MRTRKMKEIEAVGAALDTKVNHEPTDQLRNLTQKKRKENLGKIDTFLPIDKAGPKEPEILKFAEEQPRKRMILCKMTDEEKEMLNTRNEWIRDQRRKVSIAKMLKETAQNKYSPLIGKKIKIEGELYEVKPIERKSKDRK